MKVLLLNGSARSNGCTYTALEEACGVFARAGIETEIFQVGGAPIRDCIGCHQCNEKGCIFDDDVANDFIAKAKEADAFVFGTPVYYAHPSGRILSLLDRVFYSSAKIFRGKPVFSISSARRAGTTAALDVMSKYYGIAGMLAVGSNYWTVVHGNQPEEVKQDLEGLQAVRQAASYMVWLMNCIEAGKKQGIDIPSTESKIKTNFIR